MNGKKALKISSWNLCNGLINKVDYVRNLLQSEDIDILFLQETELKINYNEDIIKIQGYNIETSNTESTKRIAAYIKNNINYTRVTELEETNVILLNIEAKYTFTQIIGIYRPFKLTANVGQLDSFKRQINEITKFMRDDTNKILIGDVNLDYLKKNVQIYAQRRIYDELLEAANAFDLTQLVSEITWARIYQGQMRSSILDHVYTNNEDQIGDIRVEKLEISDHSVVIIKTKGMTNKKGVILYQYDCWKAYSKEALLEELHNSNLRELHGLPTQELSDKLDQILGKIRDKLVVTKTGKKKTEDSNLPSHIILMKNKLKNMYKRAKRESNVALMKRSRRLEKTIRCNIKTSKENKIRIEAGLGPNNLWKAVKIANGVSQSELPTLVKDDNSLTETDKEKAELFADAFTEKITNIVNEVRPEDGSYEGVKKIFGNYEQNWINEDIVSKTIDELKPKRCEGYDRIPLLFFKDGKDELLETITILMKKVTEDSYIPEQWKVAKVMPIHKKGKRTSVNNYRPISNLCSVTKIFEKLILNRLAVIEKIENCDITGESQHGFKKNRSTESACLEIQSRIAEGCEEKKFVTVASLDLTAAFDVINHTILVKRMKKIGIPMIIINVVREWLTGRAFYVDVKGKSSTIRELTHGTVQGSVLGPILFAIYISPLEGVVTKPITFADDNYLLDEHEDLTEVLSIAAENISKMTSWFTMNGLKVNQEKTELCVFHKNDYPNSEIIVNNNSISVKNHMKILGVFFDSKLNWHMQAKMAIEKSNRVKQGLRILRKYFTPEEMLRLSTAYFYSTLYYGARIWLLSTLNANIKKQLWQSSSRMLKIVDGDWKGATSFVNLHRKYKRATPAMWCKYTTAMSMWDIIKHNVPEKAVVKATMNRQYSGRNEGTLFTRSNTTKIGYNCISNRLQVVSRALDFNWQDLSKDSYKMKCKNVFIEQELNRLQ